jgi:mannose/fructose/N-acetylgalactosamine-specific phosphotransferase system component IIC
MSEYVARLFAGAMIGWFCAFVAVLVYWINGEAIEPGQQFADPLVPCVFVGYLFGTLPGMIIAGLTARRR